MGIRISNNIIKNEYIKIVCTVLKIDERALLQELRKTAYSQTQVPQLNPIKPKSNVTKSSNLTQKWQKNLLSLYLTDEGILNKQLLSETIKNVDFTDENLEIIKQSIDKILLSVNNIKDLICV